MFTSMLTIGNAQEIFGDFPEQIIEQADTNGDGVVSNAEALSTTSLTGLEADFEQPEDGAIPFEVTFFGLERFVNLEVLELSGSFNLIDLSIFPKLKHLDLSESDLIQIDLSNNPELITLNLNNNLNIERIFSGNFTEEVEALYHEDEVFDNGGFQLINQTIRELDLSNNPLLEELTMTLQNDGFRISNLDFSNNPLLSSIDFSLHFSVINPNINFSNNTNLTNLTVRGPGIRDIDISNNINLTNLTLFIVGLTDLDLAGNVNLSDLSITDVPLTGIDFSNNANLSDLTINRTDITTLDVTPCSINSINFSNNPDLESVFMNGQPLNVVDGGGEVPDFADVFAFVTPSLELICVDEIFIDSIIDTLNRPEVEVSDCDSDAPDEPTEYSDVLTLFPNPTTGIININTVGTEFIPNVSFISSLSMVFIPLNLQLQIHTGPQSTFDLTALPSGAYLITTIDALGQSYSTTFIKN